MRPFVCPICSQRNPAGVPRCTACGADFDDPDVRAMAGEAGLDLPHLAAPPGSLTSGKFLGISEIGLREGSSLRRLGLIGALLLAGAFCVPVSLDFESYTLAWRALDSGPSIPLLYPALAALIGLAAAFLPLLPWQRGAMLLLAGTVGLCTLPWLGAFAGTPQKLMPALTAGLVLAGSGLILRGFDAQSRMARYLVIAGTVLCIAAYFIPMSDSGKALPVEFRLFLDEQPGDGLPIKTYGAVASNHPVILFTSVYLFLPLLLLPVAAFFAWQKPTGVWDKTGLLLKPLSWIFVLYVPLGFALYLFNLMGGLDFAWVRLDGQLIRWDDFNQTALVGRLRLLLLGSVFALWAQLPAVALYHGFPGLGRDRRQAPSPER